jgi:UDP-N-acetylglucosamine 4,6-dehydratase
MLFSFDIINSLNYSSSQSKFLNKIDQTMKKNILITGGNGFLGKALALNFKKGYNIYLGSRNNKNNFEAEKITNCKSLPLDVSNYNSVKDAIEYSKPSIIIHAAATKFVGWSETHPFECSDINMLGSTNIARCAIDKKVKTVIGISTDKATQPIKNFYGMSKAVMEKIFLLANKKSYTNFIVVRYGNVAWSTGSVLPIWREMFLKNKIIETTGPYMRRFFFTIDNAVQLVDVALKKQKILAGKILCPDMKSSKMIDILKIWKGIYGGKYKTIKGREGDRQDEFLVADNEIEYCMEKSFYKKKYYIIDFEKKLKRPLKKAVTSENCKKLTKKEIVALIKNINL